MYKCQRIRELIVNLLCDLVTLSWSAEYCRTYCISMSVLSYHSFSSLWGAVRYSNPIPWDNDLDIALLSNEMRLVDHNALYQEFQMKNISIYYRAWFGTYRVTRATARGDLMVFRETYFGEMSRTGIESWVCFLNHRNYHMFPSRLFKIPLPMLPFADVNFSVPRGGIEIQKHFYPNDWWKENKLDDCWHGNRKGRILSLANQIREQYCTQFHWLDTRVNISSQERTI